MPTKTILSPAQRTAIFDPPADRATIERLYTLGPDDLAQVARRRAGPTGSAMRRSFATCVIPGAGC